MIKFVFGLANPSESYDLTRHNAGAWLINLIIQHYNLSFKMMKNFKAKIASLRHNDTKIIFAIPTIYMNMNGMSVNAIAHFYKINVQDILIIHDDIDLDTGKIRLKYAGGSAGHNGLKSIISCLGNDFWRIRIGIGRPANKMITQVSSYVLQKPTNNQKQIIKLNMHKVLSFLDDILQKNMSIVMQNLHTIT